MAVRAGISRSVITGGDREILDNPEIPEWKRLLIMKKRSGSNASAGSVINDERKIARSGEDLSQSQFAYGNKTGSEINAPCDQSSSISRSHNENYLSSRKFKTSLENDGKNCTDGSLPHDVEGKDAAEVCDVRKSAAERRRVLANNVSKSPSESISLNDLDDHQDLQYGPGIVNRLKSRFISMSLKESEKNLNSGRRYSSLENLLDNDNAFQATCAQITDRPTAPGNKAKNNLGQRSSNFKKAKSMETLLVNSEQRNSAARRGGRKSVGSNRPQVLNCSSGSMLVNENVVIFERSPSPRDNKCLPRSKRKEFDRQLSAPSINEEELPKPDTVKTFKRIFEPPDAKPNNHSFRMKSPTTKGSAKIVTSTLSQSRVNQTVKTVECHSNGIPAKPSAKEPSVIEKEMEQMQNGDVTDYSHDGKDEDIKYISKEALDRIRSHGVTMTFGNETTNSGNSNSQSSKRKATETLQDSGVTQISPPPSPAKDNASDKMEEFTNTHSHVDNTHSKPSNNGPSENLEQVQSNIVVSPDSETNSISLSEDEDDENSADDDEVLKPSTLLGIKKVTWQKPPPSTTTVIFDFRGQDVKPNISLNPTPFGCKPAKVARNKRSGSPPRVDGKNSTSSAINGVLLDDSYELSDCDDIDEMDIGADLPALSGIVFVGENVKVGRGALLTRRNKKLRIQFDDNATAVFEYPSEVCGGDEFCLPSSLSPIEFIDGVSGMDSPSRSEVFELMSSNLRPTSDSFFSGLSSYTPSLLSSSETFQLGVSRPQYREPSPPPVPKSSPQVTDEILKPVDPSDTTNWSSSSTSDILF